MKNASVKTKLILSAVVAGMLSACSSSANNEPQKPQNGSVDNAAASSAPAPEKQAKHECKGKNSCKGAGGCAAGDNGCKGKNSCKGHGGCATDDSAKNKPESKETNKAETKREKSEKNSCSGKNGCGAK